VFSLFPSQPQLIGAIKRKYVFMRNFSVRLQTGYHTEAYILRKKNTKT